MSVWANFFTYSGYVLLVIFVFIVAVFIEKAVKKTVAKLVPNRLEKIKPLMDKGLDIFSKILSGLAIVCLIFIFAYDSSTPKASSELKMINDAAGGQDGKRASGNTEIEFP